MDEPSAAKRPSVLTIDRAAFLLLRVKRAFKKKRQQRKEKHTSTATTAAKTTLDLKRRSDLVDEAFLEQKDILLDMLEAKLKEVRDKKKKKSDRVESNSVIAESIKCELLPNDVDLKLQASGIIAVGETDVQLKFGDSGNSNLNLNATGISNVGKTNLKLGIGDGTINIPGLSNLLLGATFLRAPCEKQKVVESKNEPKPNKIDINYDETVLRRSMGLNYMKNDTVSYSVTNKTSNINKSSSSLATPLQSNVTQSISYSSVTDVHNSIPVI